MNSTAPLGVLVVGAGYRVQNCFLPVFRTLEREFKVVGIHARSAARLQPVADHWGVPAVANLDGTALRDVDVVAISVPVEQNIPVIRALLPHATRLSLIVDTPGAANVKQFATIAPLLAQFRAVAFTEDHMNLPHYALLREAVKQGFIGTPKTLTLFHTGYVYHGLAIIRAFAGLQPVVRSRRHRVGALTSMIVYKFRSGFEGCVINPYHTNQPDGGFILEGSAGIISPFPSDLAKATASRPAYLLKPRHTDGLLSGYVIEAGAKSIEIDLPGLREMRQMPIEDISDYNLLRNCGMATIFRSISEPERDAETTLNAAYGANNALYDSYVSRLAERGRLPFDPLTWVGSNVMRLMPLLNRFRG